jgi:hypothetical protein
VIATIPSIASLVFSRDGFDPKIWGPHLWKIMHILAMNFPLTPTPTQTKAYYDFFKSLCAILPCATCRGEFCAMVNRPGPLQLTPRKFVQSRDEPPGSARLRVVTYVIDLHQTVNNRLRKGGPPRSREYWIEKYAKLRK